MSVDTYLNGKNTSGYQARELDGVKRVDLLWEEETIRAELVEGAAITREQIMEAMKKADYPYEYTIKKP